MMDRDDIEQGLRMEEVLNKMGLSMYTDEWAAKVLAFVHCMRGTDEVIVTNPALHFAIECSFKKLYANQRLNPDFWELMQRYMKELEADGLRTPWLHDIAKRYGLNDLKGMWENAGRK